MKKVYFVFIIIALTVFLAMVFRNKQSTTENKTTSGSSLSSSSAVQDDRKEEMAPAAIKEPENKTISLTVSEPLHNSVSTSQSVWVKGKTVPNVELFINNQDFKADNKGNFAVQIILDEGENVIVVVAVDEEGNIAEKELSITYNSGEIYE